ncbi:MAG: hypothetical protein STSR0007_05970 [Thermovirga sp.]
MRTRKTILSLAVSLFGMLLVASTGLSHPPASLDLDYAADEGVLSISIAHSVGDVATHYIKNIKVSVDGRQTADLHYVSQGDKGGEKILVTIGWFGKGTQISVIAECSRFGTLNRKLVL